MTAKMITVPELGIIAGTRAALGAGVGLLLADFIDPGQRRAIGWTLLAVGVLTTIPLVAEVFFRQEKPANDEIPESSVRNQQRAVART